MMEPIYINSAQNSEWLEKATNFYKDFWLAQIYVLNIEENGKF